MDKRYRRSTIFLSLAFTASILAGCAAETPPGAPSGGPRTGCCYFYQDYRWGDYPWETKHYNPGEVWDDYYHDFGRHWHGQEGEIDTGQPSEN